MAARTISVIRLSAVHYQHPDLDKAVKFLEDFGLNEVSREGDKVYYAGFGVDPYLYIAEKSPDGKRHFLGGTWVVESRSDLDVAALHAQAATGVVNNEAPGGGEKVTLIDPNGFPIHFVHGQQLRERKTGKEITKSVTADAADLVQNAAYEKQRQGGVRRFVAGASPVHKLGHYGFVIPVHMYELTFSWYTSLFNLKPSDSVFHPATGKDTTCFMHIDRGETYTDHHSFFLGVSPEGSAHVHHSSFEVNDLDTEMLGHDYLRNQGWTNCWGIGRHVLGSQIFDYWFDASGNIVEHYSDGDLVNEKTPWGREPEAPDSLYIWGPNLPLSFFTGRPEDAGKPLPPPPENHIDPPSVAMSS